MLLFMHSAQSLEVLITAVELRARKADETTDPALQLGGQAEKREEVPEMLLDHNKGAAGQVWVQPGHRLSSVVQL